MRKKECEIYGETKKPVIGVCPLYDETKESIWMLPGYLEGLKEAGSIPVILPLTAERLVTKRLTHR